MIFFFLFKSYLLDRTQLIYLSGTHPSCSPITCGIPQGLMLGSLLYLVYVNDMSAVVKNKLLLYVDDSGILVSSKNKQDIEQLLTQWLIDNKLSLHLGTT